MSFKNEVLRVVDCMIKGHDYLRRSVDTTLENCKDIFGYAVNAVNKSDDEYYKYRRDKNFKNADLEGIVSKNYYKPENLSKIIELKNKYFWKNDMQLYDIIRKETKTDIPDVSKIIRDAMKLKVSDPRYSGISRINYDSGIASQDMKDYFVQAYTSSDKTLKKISQEFEKKYGMHISISTISNNARKYLRSHGLEFKNRREARKYYAAAA